MEIKVGQQISEIISESEIIALLSFSIFQTSVFLKRYSKGTSNITD